MPLRHATSPTGPGRRGRLAGTRVLAVDDDDRVLQLVSAVLTRQGATVQTTTSARTGLALVDTFHPHVLLSDLSMPDEDGFWLIAQIRAAERYRHTPSLPAAAVSALTSAADRAHALAAGFDTHVAKPVSAVDLAALVADLARKAPPNAH